MLTSRSSPIEKSTHKDFVSSCKLLIQWISLLGYILQSDFFFFFLGDILHQFFASAVFVLGENYFWKCFSGNEVVWLVRKILFSRNWNPLTQKKSLWPRKCFYTSILPSKDFRKMRERERERARARAQGEDPVRDRELQLQSEIAIAPISARSREGEIAIAP